MTKLFAGATVRGALCRSAAAVVAAAVALGGCSADNEPDPTPLSPGTDSDYLMFVRLVYPPLERGNSEAILKYGHMVCDSLDDGMSPSLVFVMGTAAAEDEATLDAVKALFWGALTVLCPEYLDALEEEVSGWNLD